MLIYKKEFVILFSIVVLIAAIASADTWKLENNNLNSVSNSPDENFNLRISKIKLLVAQGNAQQLSTELDKLKADYPDIISKQLDEFIAAEKLLTQGKYEKAAKKYQLFIDQFPKSPLYSAAIDRQFWIAKAYLKGRKKKVLGMIKIRGYAEGKKMMDKIEDRTGVAPVALDASIAVAENLENRRKFDQAYQKWMQISDKWPTGKIAKDALLAKARCQLASYKGPSFSDQSLKNAKSYYIDFKQRYSADAKKLGISNVIEHIDQELAIKQLQIAKFYNKTKNAQAANFYYQMVIDNWPDSIAAELAKNEFKSQNNHIPQEK